MFRVWTVSVCAFVLLWVYGQQSAKSLLLDYVALDDGAFSWTMENKTETPVGVTIYELKLTSQRWKDILWRHTLLIVQPPKITTDLAVLVINGGETESKGDTQTRLLAATIAIQIQAIVAVLFAVPNQPLFNGLKEDDLLAHTFVKVLETGDKEWACLLPMTKSAVKAMDAIQQFAQKEINTKVNGFLVTGASKRGWTTWLTAVADPSRVKGIAPIVYDNLNIPAQMKHQKEVFGTYSEQISEYVKRGLVDLVVGDGKGKELVQLVDPYAYREKITMPKLIINGTNDRYWALDAANFYFQDLVGEKHILYVPNVGHGLEGGLDRVLRTLVAFFNRLSGRIELPKLQWKWKCDGSNQTLTIHSNPMPKEAIIWTTQSPTKDFRDSKWSDKLISPEGDEVKFVLQQPESGYAAAFAELVYEIGGHRFSLCTTISIVGK